MADDKWLYSRGDNHQGGPVSAKELNRLAETGEVRPDDLVWKEGMDEWVPANRIKGLNFPATPPPKKERPLNAESLQSTLRDVQQTAEKAAGTFWFFDLKFDRFVTGPIIRIVWAVYLLFGSLGLVFTVVGSIFKYPILEAALWSGLSIVGFIFLALMLRVWLEAFMVIFRMSERLQQINEKLSSK